MAFFLHMPTLAFWSCHYGSCLLVTNGIMRSRWRLAFSICCLIRLAYIYARALILICLVWSSFKQLPITNETALSEVWEHSFRCLKISRSRRWKKRQIQELSRMLHRSHWKKVCHTSAGAKIYLKNRRTSFIYIRSHRSERMYIWSVYGLFYGSVEYKLFTEFHQ